MKLFRNMRIWHRLLIILALAAAGTLVLVAISLSSIQTTMLREKQVSTRHAVETAYGVLEHFHRLQEAGSMTQDAAQAEALAELKALRYEGGEYFWVNDMRPFMVMHPVKPDGILHEVSRLSTVEGELRDHISVFETDGDKLLILELARTDHRVFVGHIHAHLRGEHTVDPARLQDNHECRFGKWYDNEGRQHCGGHARYQAIDQPHQQVHALAKSVVIAHDAGNRQEAEKQFAELERQSDLIIEHLEGLKKECGMA